MTDRVTDPAPGTGRGSVGPDPLTVRDWGHSAAYSADLDGHVLAFACEAGSGIG